MHASCVVRGHVRESFAYSTRVLWVWTTVLFPSPNFLSLFGSLIKQDRRADRRETLVDSAKSQERSTRGLVDVHRGMVDLDGMVSGRFPEVEVVTVQYLFWEA